MTAGGSLRDRTIIVLMLHTGLRAREVCTLKTQDVTLGKRSGVLRVLGKRNKYREVPLNSTVRSALTDANITSLPASLFRFSVPLLPEGLILQCKWALSYYRPRPLLL